MRRFTRVEAELGGGFLRVRIFAAGARGRSQVHIVLAPEDLAIRDAQLPGEFILWRAPQVKPPAHIPLQKNESVYRYLALDDIRLTHDGLVAAVLEGKAEVAEWDYRRSGGDYVWRRTVAEPRFRQLRSARPAPGDQEQQEAEAEERESPRTARPPPPDPTHILCLSDGRRLAGRLISENTAHIVFAVRTGSAEFETRFAAAEVEAVDPIE